MTVAAVVLAAAAAAAPQPQVTATLTPATHVVGAPVVAELSVFADDDADVRVTASFEPYEEIAARQRERADAGDAVRITYRFTLACLSLECLPRGRRVMRLPPARIRIGDEQRTVAWPAATIVSQLGGYETRLRRLEALTGRAARPWVVSAQALLLPLRTEREPPRVTYRLAPRALAAGLLGVAALALAGAAIVAAPLVRRRRVFEPPPLRERSPLDEALALVRTSLENGSSRDRRAALERLARELAAFRRRALVERTRALAWSAEAPERANVERLLQDVER
jgi:hypothetical protein